MLLPTSSLAIAILVFYAPAPFLSLPLIIRHGRPRLAWFMIFIMSLIRIASAVLLLLHNANPSNLSYTKSAQTLLSVGVFPLLLATIGLVRIIRLLELPHSKPFFYTIVFQRLLFLASIALLIVGAILLNPSPTTPSEMSFNTMCHNFVRASSILSLLLLLTLTAQFVYVGCVRSSLSVTTRTMMLGFVAIGHLLLLRILYFILSSFGAKGGLFGSVVGVAGASSKTGSMAALVCMELIPEWAVVVVFLVVGWTVGRIGKEERREGSVDVEALGK